MGWNSIIGNEKVVQSLKRVVLDLKKTKSRKILNEKLKIKEPKGLILHGPPGTGKTLLAKVFAKECGLPFLEKTSADIISSNLGSSAKAVKKIFVEARSLAEKKGACVLFLDEIDSIAQKRGRGADSGSREKDSVLTQFLIELGRDCDHIVYVIGATNHLDRLDPAFIRSGRFDKKIKIRLPRRLGRLKALNFFVAQRTRARKGFGVDAVLEKIAEKTSGKCVADLERIVQDAFENLRDELEIESAFQIVLSPRHFEKRYQISKTNITHLP